MFGFGLVGLLLSAPVRASLPRILDLLGRPLQLKARRECSPFFPWQCPAAAFFVLCLGFPAALATEIQDEMRATFLILLFVCSLMFISFFINLGIIFEGGGHPWGPLGTPRAPRDDF